jgi:hypothetical protein
MEGLAILARLFTRTQPIPFIALLHSDMIQRQDVVRTALLDAHMRENEGILFPHIQEVHPYVLRHE